MGLVVLTYLLFSCLVCSSLDLCVLLCCLLLSSLHFFSSSFVRVLCRVLSFMFLVVCCFVVCCVVLCVVLCCGVVFVFDGSPPPPHNGIYQIHIQQDKKLVFG